MAKQVPAHFMNKLGPKSFPSCQVGSDGAGPNGGKVQTKDGRANTNAGGYEQQMKPWPVTDANGRTVDWRAGQ
jgi:hypothetical protein